MTVAYSDFDDAVYSIRDAPAVRLAALEAVAEAVRTWVRLAGGFEGDESCPAKCEQCQSRLAMRDALARLDAMRPDAGGEA